MLIFFLFTFLIHANMLLGDLGIHFDLKAIHKKNAPLLCDFTSLLLLVGNHMKPLCYLCGGIWVFTICYLSIDRFVAYHVITCVGQLIM